MKVVCNSTPLISLSSIKKLYLLKDLFGEITIPEKVFDEVVVAGSEKYGSSDVKECSWIKVSKTSDNILKSYLMQTLDEGEAEVIVLADELKADLRKCDEQNIGSRNTNHISIRSGMSLHNKTKSNQLHGHEDVNMAGTWDKSYVSYCGRPHGRVKTEYKTRLKQDLS